MNIHESVAIAPSAYGFWEDGWLDSRSFLPILIYDPCEWLEIDLWIPAEFAPRTAQFRAGDWSSEIILVPDQTIPVHVPVDHEAMGVVVSITIPEAAPAAPPDVRTVGAVLAAIMPVNRHGGSRQFNR